MPIFEYVCDACGSSFEKLVMAPSSAGPVECDRCGSGEVTRRLSTFSARSGSRADSPARRTDGGRGSAGGCGRPGGCGCA